MSEKTRSANIFDVARLAGVSHQTVSRVLNDLPNVRPATRERVEQAIKQLRYTPSPAARALVTKRSRILGLIATSAASFGPASTALHVNEAARTARYSVLTISMLTADAAAVQLALDSLIRQNAEGIVLISQDRAVLDSIYGSDTGIPLITIDPDAPDRLNSASIDQRAGARLAVRHLVELGHREIAHLSGPPRSPDAVERLRGWTAELMAHGLVARTPSHGDWTPASGYEFGMRFEVGDPYTAIFVANDQMALGLMRAMDERGLQVPRDVSVVGFDDIPEAAYLGPPLTTVRQDFARLGELTVQRLVTAIEGEPLSEVSRIPVELIVRASTRAVG
ncbi:MAG TPA: substrate-binding domain-containing protein [Humibacter sp.]|nr:substrate-binding domain-containing protein [Humibacter sp.]